METVARLSLTSASIPTSRSAPRDQLQRWVGLQAQADPATKPCGVRPVPHGRLVYATATGDAQHWQLCALVRRERGYATRACLRARRRRAGAQPSVLSVNSRAPLVAHKAMRRM
jgi:hypothetical protein